VSTKAARELAQKIAAQIDRDKKISIEVVDLTGHAQAANLNPVQILIETELRARGFHVVTDSSYDTKIRITLSQDSAERLWVADFTADGKQSVMMIPFERTTSDLSAWATRVHVSRELVYSQTSPMLDFGCDNSEGAKDCGEMLVLNPDSVVLMAPERKFPSAPIPHNKPWPRDLRGRIRRVGPAFDVNVGSMSCFGKTNVDGLMFCLPAPSQELLFFGPFGEQARAVVASEQNWFEWIADGAVGTNAARLKRPPFYSISGFEVSGQAAWVVSGTDGQVRVFTGKSKESLASTSGWGADLATVKSNCGAGWQILATTPRDYSENDSIIVYELVGVDFRAESDPIEMDGPIVSMWSGENGEPARAVVHNLKTGNYEAYLLKVGCSQ